MNEERREATDLARKPEHSRRVLGEEDLTDRQSAKLAWIAANAPRPHRAYLLKESLRTVCRIARAEGLGVAVAALDRRLARAQRFGRALCTRPAEMPRIRAPLGLAHRRRRTSRTKRSSSWCTIPFSSGCDVSAWWTLYPS